VSEGDIVVKERDRAGSTSLHDRGPGGRSAVGRRLDAARRARSRRRARPVAHQLGGL